MLCIPSGAGPNSSLRSEGDMELEDVSEGDMESEDVSLELEEISDDE